MSQDDEVPLGERESYYLEFKARDILKNPTKIGREVVGFLNADGGAIWIGIPEKEGMAVPPLESISSASKEIDALRDHLVATIEPPIQNEVEPAVVTTPEGASLIKIAVRKGQRGPYAQIDRGRHFLIRVADRLRDMSRQEIVDRIRNSPPSEDHVTEIIEKLRTDQEKAAELHPPRLWLRLQPTEDLAIDFDDQPTRDQFQTWLTDAKATGNRPDGWNFVLRLQEPKSRFHRIENGDPEIPYFTRVMSSGEVEFTLSTARLYPLTGGNMLLSFALLEYPVSVFRLMARVLKMYAGSRPEIRIAVGMTISGLKNAQLAPGSPRDLFPGPWRRPKAVRDDADRIEIDPSKMVFDRDQVADAPDRCAFRVIRAIYDAYDFGEEDIPPEFDRRLGVLILP